MEIIKVLQQFCFFVNLLSSFQKGFYFIFNICNLLAIWGSAAARVKKNRKNVQFSTILKHFPSSKKLTKVSDLENFEIFAKLWLSQLLSSRSNSYVGIGTIDLYSWLSIRWTTANRPGCFKFQAIFGHLLATVIPIFLLAIYAVQRLDGSIFVAAKTRSRQRQHYQAIVYNKVRDVLAQTIINLSNQCILYTGGLKSTTFFEKFDFWCFW